MGGSSSDMTRFARDFLLTIVHVLIEDAYTFEIPRHRH